MVVVNEIWIGTLWLKVDTVKEGLPVDSEIEIFCLKTKKNITLTVTYMHIFTVFVTTIEKWNIIFRY